MRIPICWAMIFGAMFAIDIAAQGDKGKDAKIAVRALKFAPKDVTILYKIGGLSKLTTLADAEAVEKLVGKESAKGLVDAVDFTKEQIVLVSWTTAGPPEGTLKHEMRDGKIHFFIQGPDAKTRGARARLGADFFAVPRDSKVALDPRER